ncbi:MAG: sulfite exporter TauE/SafE family protein [Xanthobacteraceae bacterium]
MPFIPDVSLPQLALIVGLAAFSAVAGGIAGYGTGALMPLVLVPLVGAQPVVPIIAVSAMFTNAARIVAFRKQLDARRALVALVAALPTCLLGAWLYTSLNGRGAALLIGSTLIATVPLRRILKKRGHRLGAKGYAAGALAWGLVAGGSLGAGVILLSLLMAVGLEGAAVIATDAMVSLAVGVAKLAVFGVAGVLTPVVLAVGLLIGVVGFFCTFLARLIVERLPVHVHAAILDVVVILGAGIMMVAALR